MNRRYQTEGLAREGRPRGEEEMLKVVRKYDLFPVAHVMAVVERRGLRRETCQGERLYHTLTFRQCFRLNEGDLAIMQI